MWNRGEPLSFTKRWNPFTNEIPFTTYTSHPLLWHKGIPHHLQYLEYICTINTMNSKLLQVMKVTRNLMLRILH
jgi:hypothetical protein